MKRSIERITVVGTGSWGTALAAMLSREHEVTLLCRSKEEAEKLSTTRRNERFLPSIVLPEQLCITADPEIATSQYPLVIMVVPSVAMRENIRLLSPYLSENHIVLSAAKGFEPCTELRMTQVLQAELPGIDPKNIGALSGPNIALEVAEGKPTTSVVAFPDEQVAMRVINALTTKTFRIYGSRDVVGVEIAGALKNVIAIGAGAIDGLAAGNNAKVAFVTRGIAEISRFGIAQGANPLTFAGLAGIGDLIVTITSKYSRNRWVGQEFAKGRKLADILAELHPQVAEGVETTRTAWKMAQELAVDMPIIEQTYKVMFEGKPVHEALIDLMNREPKFES